MTRTPLLDSQRLSSLLEAVDAAIITIDDQGIILEVNSATCRIFGYEQDELLGKNVKILMPSPFRQEHDQYLENHRTTGEKKIIGSGRRVEGLHESGRIFPIHLSVAKFTEQGTNFYTGIIHDLTELSQAEAESLKLERIIDECINEVYTFHRHSMRITSASRAALDNLGYSRDEILGLTPLDLVVSLTREELQSSMDRLRRGEEELFSFAHQLKRRDGSVYTAELQLYYLDELNPPEFATIAMDVTEKHRMMESVRQSQRMESIGNLTGGIAHDFNNILTVVLGNTELLKMSERSDDDNELLTEIADAAQMGSRLTSRLLAFARRKSLAPEIVDINQLIRNTSEMLERMLDSNIELVVSLCEQPAMVSVDVSEIENALINLVVNSKDAMPEGGRVAIESSVVEVDHMSHEVSDLIPGPYVRLTVSDTGHGIDNSIKDTIFEPFVSTKAESQGTGLGLSMVYGFVKQSGGHIYCYSEFEKGTSFTIYLPQNSSGNPGRKETDQQQNPVVRQKKLILVAEDDDRVRKLTIRRLERMGHSVLAAPDGHQALEMFQQEPGIDLVFSDVVMTEGMTGYDLALAIRKINPETPILLTSGYAENVLNAEELEKSGLSLLRKPFEQSELIKAIEQLTE